MSRPVVGSNPSRGAGRGVVGHRAEIPDAVRAHVDLSRYEDPRSVGARGDVVGVVVRVAGAVEALEPHLRAGRRVVGQGDEVVVLVHREAGGRAGHVHPGAIRTGGDRTTSVLLVERTVERLGPEAGPGGRVERLRGDIGDAGRAGERAGDEDLRPVRSDRQRGSRLGVAIEPQRVAGGGGVGDGDRVAVGAVALAQAGDEERRTVGGDTDDGAFVVGVARAVVSGLPQLVPRRGVIGDGLDVAPDPLRARARDVDRRAVGTHRDRVARIASVPPVVPGQPELGSATGHGPGVSLSDRGNGPS